MNSSLKSSNLLLNQMSKTLKPRAWILDVGHGNSTVVEEPGHVSIVDGGRRNTLLQFLEDQGIYCIDTVIVSHADADHFGGISLLLSDDKFRVSRVFLNPDVRATDLWDDFVSVMRDAKKRGTEFNLELTDENPGHLVFDKIRLEVLFPPQEFAYRTSEGFNPGGGRLTPNSMSAVVRVCSGDLPRLLLAGDIDQPALDHLINSDVDIEADVLVFPHHGGLPGRTADPEAFAKSLGSRVRAQLVIFSIGRGNYNTPRPEIVSGVLAALSDAHIACTQLSTHCADELPPDSNDLHAQVSRGLTRNACCAGTLEISLDDEFTYSPDRERHIEFVRRFAPTALCRAQIGLTS